MNNDVKHYIFLFLESFQLNKQINTFVYLCFTVIFTKYFCILASTVWILAMTGQIVAFNLCAFARKECVRSSVIGLRAICLPVLPTDCLLSLKSPSSTGSLGEMEPTLFPCKNVGLHLVNVFKFNCNVCTESNLTISLQFHLRAWARTW